MGIYHLMGVGFYIGAVTSPLAYVAERIRRNDESDKAFLRRFVNAQNLNSSFDTKALIVFATPDFLAGKSEREDVYGYTLDLEPKSLSSKEVTGEKTEPQKFGKGKSGMELLQMALGDVARRVDGTISLERKLAVYWCVCPFDNKDANKVSDALLSFERISLVLETLRAEAQGSHHIWVCMNGGPGSISSSLALAVNLSPMSVRQYSRLQKDNSYALVQKPATYWVDQPPIALGFSEFNRRLKLYAPESVLNKDITNQQKGYFDKKLFEALVTQFTISELKQLCFDTGVDEERVGDGKNKDSFVRELILYCERRDLLAELIICARIARPNIRIDEIILPNQSPEWLLMRVVSQFGQQGVKIDEALKHLSGMINADRESFEQKLIEPMNARGYLICDGDILREGPEWGSTSLYFKAQIKAQSEACLTLDELARNHELKPEKERWFYKQAIEF